MSKEIIEEEDDISEFEIISAQEDQEGYRMKSTFDNRKLQKIQNLNFDLKAPGEGLLSYLNKRYMHRKYTIHEYQKIERSITINKANGNIKLNLLTKETINETLSKIKNDRIRDKIKYVYLAGVQIIIKSLFPENLNTPIVLSLHDKRLIQTHESHLGSIQGNLAYTKLMFTCYPKYSINLGDKDFDNSLSLYFKFLRNDFMKEGNCEVPTPGPTRRWSPSSPPGSLDDSPHSLGYPPAHRVSFASAGIRTRHQELKVLREAPLLPTELVAQLVAGVLP